MVKIKVDESKQRIYITISGVLSLLEARKAKESIERAIQALSPGFAVINDISKLIRADEEGGVVLKEIILLLMKSGVRKIIRVVGTSKTGLIQFANNSIPLDNYELSYVPSLEEAERLLSESENNGQSAE